MNTVWVVYHFDKVFTPWGEGPKVLAVCSSEENARRVGNALLERDSYVGGLKISEVEMDRPMYEEDRPTDVTPEQP